MASIKDLLNSIVSGDTEAATQIFADTMNEKLQSAVEDRRKEVAQSMFGEGKSEYESGKEEQEDEDENESDDSEDSDKEDSDSDEKEDDSEDSDKEDRGDVKTKKSGKKITVTVDEETEKLDELVSPFSMHPANVLMKKAGIADNDFLPPPANFVTSVAQRLGKKLASPSKPASSEAPAGLDKLGDDGKTCDSPGGCGMDKVGAVHKAVTDVSQNLSKAHRARFGANNPYLQKEETEDLDEAETTYTSSTGRIKATMQPGQPGTTIEPALADKAAALKLKMSKTLSTK